ncbi:MAG: uroporphyrinogen-III synthase, partial [Lachnospiraceae bacterium]|nr:uroporphyrinogen-III synthase [Lachnospiraceae bacterium]
LGSVKFAVIGTGTKKALAEHGFYADLMPDVYDAAHLGRALRDAIMNMNSEQRVFMEVNAQRELNEKRFSEDERGQSHILIPRAAAGSPELLAELGDEFLIDDIPTYETRYESGRFVNLKKEFADGKIDYVMFTSASTVRGFAQAAAGVDYTKVQAICIGKQTETAAAALGMKTYVARVASIDSLIELLCEVRQSVH